MKRVFGITVAILLFVLIIAAAGSILLFFYGIFTLDFHRVKVGGIGVIIAAILGWLMNRFNKK